MNNSFHNTEWLLRHQIFLLTLDFKYAMAQKDREESARRLADFLTFMESPIAHEQGRAA